MDIPLIPQRQIPMLQTDRKNVEVTHVQSLDKADDTPVAVRHQVPTIQGGQKMVKRCTDETGDAPIRFQPSAKSFWSCRDRVQTKRLSNSQ